MSKKHFSVKRNAVAVACGLALAAGAFAPAVAMADTNSTTVKLQASEQDMNDANQTVFTVPTEITLAVKADGTLVGPSEKQYIQNKSVFDIHVDKVKYEVSALNWTYVEDIASATAENSLSLKLNDVTLKNSTDGTYTTVTPAMNLSMANKAEGEKAKAEINLSGNVAKVNKKDISTQPVDAGTITWHVAAGKYA